MKARRLVVLAAISTSAGASLLLFGARLDESHLGSAGSWPILLGLMLIVGSLVVHVIFLLVTWPPSAMSHDFVRRQQDAIRKQPQQRGEAEHLRSLLSNVAQVKSNQDKVVWDVYGIFWAANTLLLVALATNRDSMGLPQLGPVVSSVGAVMSFVWYVIQERAIGHLERYEHIIEELERDLEVDQKYAMSGAIGRESWEFYVGGPRGLARKLMVSTSLTASVLWLVSLIYFLFVLTR